MYGMRELTDQQVGICVTSTLFLLYVTSLPMLMNMIAPYSEVHVLLRKVGCTVASDVKLFLGPLGTC